VIRARLEGWEADVGCAVGLDVQPVVTSTPHGDIKWVRIYIPKLRLYNSAHMYLIQGMPITQLLMSMSLEDNYDLKIPGPLLYVGGFPSEMWEVPFCYRGLTVGRALEAPEKLTTSELLLALFNDEMARRKK